MSVTPRRRRHPHAVRIDPILWRDIGRLATAARLDHSTWARGLLEDAVAGRVVVLAAPLGRTLKRRAAQAGMSVLAFVERLLEDALARRRR
jgi:hypothetical protein